MRWLQQCIRKSCKSNSISMVNAWALHYLSMHWPLPFFLSPYSLQIMPAYHYQVWVYIMDYRRTLHSLAMKHKGIGPHQMKRSRIYWNPAVTWTSSRVANGVIVVCICGLWHSDENLQAFSDYTNNNWRLVTQWINCSATAQSTVTESSYPYIRAHLCALLKT